MIKSISSNQLYSSIARFYDILLWLFGYKLAVHYFIGIIPHDRRAKIQVLDAGSGTGLYMFALLKRYPNATVRAFDLNPSMVEVLKQNVRRKNLGSTIEVFVGDVTTPLPFEREKFDLIITGGVLEYIKDPAVAVRNLSPYLKNGGYFLNSPVKDNLLGRVVARLYQFRPHSRASNIGAFTQNGFALEATRSFPVIKEAHLFKKL